MIRLKQKLPNWLTLGRIYAVPLMVAAYFFTSPDSLWHYWLPWSIFAWACVTDFFDGYLARIWNAQSNAGKFLDPIADKLLIVASIMILTGDGRAPVIAGLLILLREIFVAGLRECLADVKIALPVSFAGKVKTNLQMVGVGCMMVGPGAPDAWMVTEIGVLLYWIAAILTVWTGCQYASKAWAHI